MIGAFGCFVALGGALLAGVVAPILISFVLVLLAVALVAPERVRRVSNRWPFRLFGNWGNGDLSDNLGAIDYCAARGLFRRDRVVAWGGSAGGNSTFVCLTKASEIFAAGIAFYGLVDIYAFGLESHRYERYYVKSIMSPGSEQYALWHQRSPINFVDQIKASLLILQGAADPVVSQTQSAIIVKELARRHLDHEYMVYPGEGHGFRQVRHVVDPAERIDRFLRQKVL